MIDHDALFEAAARAIYSGTDLAPKPSERVAKNVIAAVLPLVADAVRTSGWRTVLP